MGRMAADVGGVLPAALALVARGVLGGDAQTLDGRGRAALAPDQLDPGDDHQIGQLVHRDAVEQVVGLAAAVEGDGRLEGGADLLVVAGGLEGLLDLVADGDQLGPLGLERLVGGVPAGVGHLLKDDVAVHPLGLGHKVPDLLAGEAEDGGDDLVQGHQDLVHGGLRCLAGRAAGAVETVLGDVEVEVGHGHHAEVVDRVVDLVEVVGRVAGVGLLQQVVEGGQGPAVDLLQLVVGQHIGVGVKAVQVAQDEAGGVADLAVGLAELLEDVLRILR